MFLQAFLVHIVEKARSNHTSIPDIIYLRHEGGKSITYKLYGDGRVIIYHGTDNPDIYLSDSVDINLPNVRILSLEVASLNDNNYHSFSKRIDEAGDLGLEYLMLLFTFEEQRVI